MVKEQNMKLRAGDKVLSPSGDLFEIVCLYRGLADVRPLKGAIKKAIESNGDIAQHLTVC
jgi:hypothetical protein